MSFHVVSQNGLSDLLNRTALKPVSVAMMLDPAEG